MAASRFLLSLHRAEIAGREAAAVGATLETCPYRSRRGIAGKYRAAWIRGYFHEQVVNLYRLDDGELTSLPIRRGDCMEFKLGCWAAIATRRQDDGGITVEVIAGGPDDMYKGHKLTDLVRGDMQE